MNPTKHTQIVKRLAREEGFDFCGISPAEFLEDEAPRLEQWLNLGKHGSMGYMENHFDKRLDPSMLVPGAQSVITLLYNHYPAKSLPEDNNYYIAKYAYGQDYHQIIKTKLRKLIGGIEKAIGAVAGRAFVDSAPVMERALAQRAGLGWIGKNSLLLNREMGSFFFIAELILDLELDYDGPAADYCGTCTRCIDACPTEAITPYEVDASKCISYFTIELSEAIPEPFKGKYANWIFGCDICQDVCPWNRFARPHHESAFVPMDDLFSMTKPQWEELSEETYQKLFKGSPLKRAKYSGLKRNIDFVKDQ